MSNALSAGGKTFRLRFSVNALAMLEEARGGDHFALIARRLTIRDLRAMLWAGLEGARDPAATPFTLDRAGEIIDQLGGYRKALDIILPIFRDQVLAPGSDEREGGGDGERPLLDKD